MELTRDYFKAILKLANALRAGEWTALEEGGMFAPLRDGVSIWATPDGIEVRGPSKAVRALRIWPAREEEATAAILACMTIDALFGGSPSKSALRLTLSASGFDCEVLAM